jgi:hypothetical protein
VSRKVRGGRTWSKPYRRYLVRKRPDRCTRSPSITPSPFVGRRVLYHLRHPNIVRFHGVSCKEDMELGGLRVLIVTEYCPHTLEELVRWALIIWH